MAFEDLVAQIDALCLQTFGKEYTLRRALTQEEVAIVGIIEEGVQLEGSAPGDGSVLALLWTTDAAADPQPEVADEIESATAVYKILRKESDAGGGIKMLLRQDRML